MSEKDDIFIVYFSSLSLNTHRFVQKLGFPSYRIPLAGSDHIQTIRNKFALITPTYGGGETKGAVPKQVINFLNIKDNRDNLVGVIAGGNTNFASAYCIAGDIISAKCKVPFLYKFELMGTKEDVEKTKRGLEEFWKTI